MCASREGEAPMNIRQRVEYREAERTAAAFVACMRERVGLDRP